MSTILFEPESFVTLAADYATLSISIMPYAPNPALLIDSLQAAYLANRAAYLMSYPQAGQIGAPRDLRPYCAAAGLSLSHGPDAARRWILAVRSLGYNCVCNNGVDYLPPRHRERLEYAARLMTDRLAGIP